MTEQDTAKLHDRLDALAAVRPQTNVYHFALSWLIGAARVNSDLRDSIEHAISYVESTFDHD